MSIQQTAAKKTIKHGLTSHKLYQVWCDMKQRCYNPKLKAYPLYGAIGITVCDEWKNDFMAFYNWAISNGWAEGLELDKDKLATTKPGKIYSPEFCSFLSPKENNQHRRNTIVIEYNNEKHTLAEWAEKLNLDASLIHDRYFNGWEAKRILTAPIKYNGQVVYNNQSKTLKEWSDFLGIKYQTIITRLSRGYSYKKAFEKSVIKKTA